MFSRDALRTALGGASDKYLLYVFDNTAYNAKEQVRQRAPRKCVDNRIGGSFAAAPLGTEKKRSKYGKQQVMARLLDDKPLGTREKPVPGIRDSRLQLMRSQEQLDHDREAAFQTIMQQQHSATPNQKGIL